MKKIGIAAILILFLNSTGFGQKSFRQSINNLNHERGVTKIELSGFLINLAGCLPFTGLEKDEKILLKSIKSLVVLNSDRKNKVNFYDKLKTEIEKNQFTKLVSVFEGEEQVVILGKPSGKGLSDLLVITSEDDDETLVYIKGNFDADMIWKLANQ